MEKFPMGPPPPRQPAAAAASIPPGDASFTSSFEERNRENDVHSLSSELQPLSSPPQYSKPPDLSSLQQEEPEASAITEANSAHKSTAAAVEGEKEEYSSSAGDVRNSSSSSCSGPYSIPPWSERPEQPFYLEVLKNGTIVDRLPVCSKGAYMFGRMDLCDFVLEHPSISRFHAVLQYRKGNAAFLYDLGSTHGSFINKKQAKQKVYTDIHVGDVIRFGQSSRLYIFNGPCELMPPEGDLDQIRKKKLQEESEDCEASLLRAKVEASLANGISWGMSEDAVEDFNEDNTDEITWQTYKGLLTDRQEKTRGKVIKRMEKVANMRKEIEIIRAKDIPQGGLTQGQQTQIARNEQRIHQIMEELDSLEETLNESIRESVGARSSKARHAINKRAIQEDDNLPSDDDEFYDRTKRKPSLRQANQEKSIQSIETADTLLDRKCAIINEMEEKMQLLEREKHNAMPDTVTNGENYDTLDAYMADLSSGLANDSNIKIQEEISSLQCELDRILYLLQIADPTGETARKRNAKLFLLNDGQQNDVIDGSEKKAFDEKKHATSDESVKSSLSPCDSTWTSSEVKIDSQKACTTEGEKSDGLEKETERMVYTVTKPQWLGAKRDVKVTEAQTDDAAPVVHGSAGFIDYKNRKTALVPIADDSSVEVASSGLLIRKRKSTEESEAASRMDTESTLTSTEVETNAEDAVALLLKHKRGYFVADTDPENESSLGADRDKTHKNSQVKRVLGPEKPDYLCNQDFESWIPPEGQSGDGRTTLNEKLGY